MHLVDGLNSGLGLNGGGIADVEKVIMKAIGSTDTMNEGRSVTLVLDGLDFLLAATGCEVLGLLDMIGELSEVRLLSKSWFHALAEQSHGEAARLFHDHCLSCRSASFSVAHYAS